MTLVIKQHRARTAILLLLVRYETSSTRARRPALPAAPPRHELMLYARVYTCYVWYI